ncbi:MBL fold metallo-hydrolase [Streptomyces sp. NPDC051940]|uniref:MBL fold metallo-hydrolase n=1 Tax=Streptomyces sp. NPDC051940 TaxID=3155675 RepID=UPI003435A36D
MTAQHPFTAQYLGGPTALLELAGVRLLTDPTFDAPRDYPSPSGTTLVKTAGPALTEAEVGEVDAVLLSHDQHADNMDHAGRAYVERAALTLSTASAATRMGPVVRALPAWEHLDLPRPDGGVLRVTAVPAQHGPDGTEHIVGEVTGFVLSGEDLPTVYVSGDNASLDVVRAIAERFPEPDVAVLFAGGVQTPLLPGEYLTLSSAWAAEATRILGARQVVPVHFEHWQHFTQGAETLAAAFAAAGLDERLHLLKPGERITL